MEANRIFWFKISSIYKGPNTVPFQWLSNIPCVSHLLSIHLSVAISFGVLAVVNSACTHLQGGNRDTGGGWMGGRGAGRWRGMDWEVGVDVCALPDVSREPVGTSSTVQEAQLSAR